MYAIVLLLLSRCWTTFSSDLIYTGYTTSFHYWGEAFWRRNSFPITTYVACYSVYTLVETANATEYPLSPSCSIMNIVGLPQIQLKTIKKTKHLYASVFKNESHGKVRSQWMDFLLFLHIVFLPPLLLFLYFFFLLPPHLLFAYSFSSFFF